ncbi:MAG: molybdopterin-synthase adenylyltransferase MoeB [Gammaproteobacteria bacterium]|nr:molybdopterin-synthase adenylyltransferase MoeB [Gammaproteobacteria bacterium]
MLNDDQLLRYSRQILLPQLDVAGQEKICAGRVLIVGLGGLGAPVSMYLAAAGVGRLVLADGDTVDLHNLQRQIVHDTASIGQSKAESARTRILALNPEIRVEICGKFLDADTAGEAVSGVDLVVDCTDNFATRFAVNAACVAQGKPLVSGAAIRFEGQVAVFNHGADAPCYACLYPDASEVPETCSENGVLAPLVGVIGSVQAFEVLKILAGVGEPLSGRLLLLDGLAMRWRELRLPKDPLCRVCGKPV